ncbi:MAG: FAD-dependent oxidoreductase [Candidatus Thorarchaeota archaeon]
MEIKKSVLVVGGGIAGLTTAQSLADFGIKITLVDKSLSAGGLLKDLGFVFPTNDCALCYEPSGYSFTAESIRKCQYRAAFAIHPNIEIACPAEIHEAKKDKNGILATIKWHPRKVDPEKCVACGLCADVCPHNAVYLPHPQAIPRAYWIDESKCDTSKCKKECVEACIVNAFVLEDEGKTETRTFDAVALATGFTEQRPTYLPYGLDKLEETITQVELANLLDTMKVKEFLGPNGEKINQVLMILCAGSRDTRSTEECSTLCCSYSLKHAIRLRELGVEVTIAFMDIRTPGHLEELYSTARESGVHFIRGRPGFIEKDENGKLHAFIEDTRQGKIQEIDIDLVVLAANLEITEPQLDIWGDIPTFKIGNQRLLNIPQTTNQAKSVALEILGDFIES